MGLGGPKMGCNLVEQVAGGACPVSGAFCHLTQRKALASPTWYAEECGGAEEGEHGLRSPFRFRGSWQVGGTQEDGAFTTSLPAFQNGAALVPGSWKVARRDGLALWASVPALWLGNLVGQWD